MADSKISALPASTTPLAGTEVLPIVQSSTTRQVSVANLTAGRAISATQLTLTTGNLIVASGQGVDFSATPGTGTSELLADYEEGDWTPVVTSSIGSITSYTAAGKYTKIGRQVTLTWYISVSNNGTGAGAILVAGAPFSAAVGNTAIFGFNQSNGNALTGAITGTSLEVYNYAALYPVATGQTINCSVTYIV
jgi:hypothetical protein